MMIIGCDLGAGPASIVSIPSTTLAASAFVLFESWAPRTCPSRDVSRRLYARLGERKSVAQTSVVPSFPTEGKLGQPQLVW
jgi:hypothetical protein